MSFSHRSPILRASGIVKRFPGVVALDGVSLELYPGEIHALLGENGSGKSTLAKVISGIYVPEEGEILLEGRPLRLLSPADAVRHGVFYVPQNPNLVERLTVAENVLIALGSYGLLSRVGGVRDLITGEAAKLGISVDPDAEVYRLSYTQRQMVELIKASLLGARVLLLDEVTTYLPKSIRELFYGYLRKLRDEGKAVVLITHKVSEAVEVADRVTVLRAGKDVGTLERGRVDANLLRELMFGDRGLNTNAFGGPQLDARSGENREPGPPLIHLRGVQADDDGGNTVLRGVDLTVERGEILGVVGISGNGQRELAEVLVGLRSIRSGRYILNGLDVTNKGPHAIRAAGVGFIPESPLYYSLSGDLSLAENAALTLYGDKVLLPRRALLARVKELMERYRVAAPSPRVQAKALSGGNVMRFTIARETEFSTKALVTLNPLRSLDEKFAASFIGMLRETARKRGISVVYISENLDEVLVVSDAVAVIKAGEIVGVFRREEARREVIEELMVM